MKRLSRHQIELLVKRYDIQIMNEGRFVLMRSLQSGIGMRGCDGADIQEAMQKLVAVEELQITAEGE